ncbi:MAG: tRNA guanosine(15) transglycosylase TgtA, partial [archaeon]|nr:tRNA guanosine(15) transglycosylase TgtA [archaeon]
TKYRDGCGRICEWKFGKYKVTTPNIAVVVNPDKQIISPKELKDVFGAEIIITNAYIIKKSKKAKQIEKDGIHKSYGWDGPVYTDSGTFQMYSQGGVSVMPDEIIAYQKAIGSDIITPLDLFTLPKDRRDIAGQKLKETMERIAMARKDVESQLLVGPVQGGRFVDLREKAGRDVGKTGADLFAIGGIVPFMEKYEFSRLVDLIMAVKMNLPNNRPVHAFGCGHPMIFSFLVLMGIDLFDSAAYALYAQDKRYMTVRGTYKVNELTELPCNCPVCSGKKPSGMSEKDIAMHNLYVTFQEIKTIRQAIADGTLFELVEQRVRAHPSLFNAYLELVGNQEYIEHMEMFDIITKGSAFFYTGKESVHRPSVYRVRKRLAERYIPPKGRKGYVIRKYERFIKSTKKTHFLVMDNLYGIVPSELLNMYPFGQTIAPANAFKDVTDMARDFVNSYIQSNRHYYSSLHILSKYKDLKELEDFEKELPDHLLELRSTLMYQYGRGAEKIIYGAVKLEVSKKTGRLRRIYVGSDLLGTIRAEDGFFISAELGARRLWQVLEKPAYRVVISDDAVPFVADGKSAFSKFVINADKDIRPYDEVLIVDSLDRLVGTGKCLLNFEEMMDFGDGVAVKTRLGFSDCLKN